MDSLTNSMATVVITTKNRRDDLRKALQSALDQTAKPQVLVIDDGSTDGTADMIRSEFPQVTLDRHEQSQGLIVQRNRGAQLASGHIVFSIDDDAVFSTPRVVEQTLGEFDDDRIGAVAMPFIDVNRPKKVMAQTDHGTEVIVQGEFVGTAHALRRELFLRLGGYRKVLFHQGEERDYCIRMLNEGYVVRSGKADPILHYESIRRDFRRMDLFGRRNDILFAWFNTPWKYLPMHLIGATARGIQFGFKVGRPIRMIHGLAFGYGSMLREWNTRQAVSAMTYRLFRKLNRRRLPLQEIENHLHRGIPGFRPMKGSLLLSDDP